MPGERDGPTTKADCLNALWRALGRDDDAVGARTLAVVLHDAEDVIDRAELSVLDALIRDHAVVQVPVVPLVVPGARIISGHYADEFAEAHGKALPIRVAMGAGMPLAGVGCAIRTDALDRIATLHGAPFDAGSLTEDYELGLRINGLRLPACFARYRDPRDGRLVAVRAYFPATLHAAVVQKSRWMTGIALAGWDRIGWGRALNIGDHWMRMRDRRAPIAVIAIAVAYTALLCWALGIAAHHLTGTPPPTARPGVLLLLRINAGLMAWRIVMRVAMTARLYGWREGLWAIPRMFVANLIAVLAARRAIDRYLGGLRGQTMRWDKTAHVFPDVGKSAT